AKSAAAARGDLAGLAALTEGQVLDYCASQVEVACARLHEIVEKSGLSLPELTDLRASLETDGRQAAAAHVDACVIAALGAANFKLGKAYGVGRGLMNLTTRPRDHATLAHHLTEERVAPLSAAIDDLS